MDVIYLLDSNDKNDVFLEIEAFKTVYDRVKTHSLEAIEKEFNLDLRSVGIRPLMENGITTEFNNSLCNFLFNCLKPKLLFQLFSNNKTIDPELKSRKTAYFLDELLKFLGYQSSDKANRDAIYRGLWSIVNVEYPTEEEVLLEARRYGKIVDKNEPIVEVVQEQIKVEINPDEIAEWMKLDQEKRDKNKKESTFRSRARKVIKYAVIAVAGLTILTTVGAIALRDNPLFKAVVSIVADKAGIQSEQSIVMNTGSIVQGLNDLVLTPSINEVESEVSNDILPSEKNVVEENLIAPFGPVFADPTTIPSTPVPTVTPTDKAIEDPILSSFSGVMPQSDSYVPSVDTHDENKTEDQVLEVVEQYDNSTAFGKFVNPILTIIHISQADPNLDPAIKAKLDKIEASIEDGEIAVGITINDRDLHSDPDGHHQDRLYVLPGQEQLGNSDFIGVMVMRADGTFKIVTLGRDIEAPAIVTGPDGRPSLTGNYQKLLAFGNAISDGKGGYKKNGDLVRSGLDNANVLIDGMTGVTTDFTMSFSMGAMESMFDSLFLGQSVNLYFDKEYIFKHPDGSSDIYPAGNQDITPVGLLKMLRMRGDDSDTRGSWAFGIFKDPGNALKLAGIIASMKANTVSNVLVPALENDISQDKSILFRGGPEADVWRYLLGQLNAQSSDFALNLLSGVFNTVFIEKGGLGQVLIQPQANGSFSPADYAAVIQSQLNN